MSVLSELAFALDPALLMKAVGLSPDPWQSALLRSSAKRKLICCCRQAGKSTVVALMAIHEALCYPPALCLLLSPSLRQSQELLRKVCTFYQALGKPIPAIQESTLRIELENQSRIISLPGKELTVRGYSGVNLLIVDEAARVPDELYFAVRPMLAVSQGRLVCLSTPFGKRGFFFEEWQNGEEWEKVLTTARDCPRISPDFLRNEEASLGLWYRQEYLCEFLNVTENVFSYELVANAITPTIEPLFRR